VSATPAAERDRFDARRAGRARGLLDAFNAVGVLSAADVHVAQRIATLLGEEHDAVILAAALAVRGPRLGHVFVDLATVRETASVDTDEPVDLGALPWPDPASWRETVAASGLVAVGEDGQPADRPLRLVGTRLYLDRYWREERQTAADLVALGTTAAPVVTRAALDEGLERLFGETAGRQRQAAEVAVTRPFAVVAGGPGTGKTTTVARIVALLAEQAQAADAPPPLVALAAPTGKAAARLEEAVHAEAATLPVADGIRDQLLALSASTVHRLLGRNPRSHSRFAHDRGNRLPHDVVIVDETSMVSLSLMSRLVEAVRPDARLILVGDPGQLTSIEAGVVLGDIVGPATGGPAGEEGVGPATGGLAGEEGIAGGIVVLDRVHRFGAGIARLAAAIRGGDADETIAALAAAPGEVEWVAADVEQLESDAELAVVRAAALDAGEAVVTAARAGEAGAAVAALGRFRLLCAHRRGPHGVSNWNSRLATWLDERISDLDLDQRDYVGRPLLVTENDYELRLYNGDAGVIVQTAPQRAEAVFERGGELVAVSPLRLGAIDTVYAMTIHKSQGSQFDTAAVLLPALASPILTRELLYTAVTRARAKLIVVGTEETLRAAVARPVARASGLRERLWGA
jgi:exodeoxyribonuclease V alpha subunit